MKRSDITDEQIVRACIDAYASFQDSAGDLLTDRTGASSKVIEAAMHRSARRGLIEYGVSLWTAWATDEGRRLLREAGE